LHHRVSEGDIRVFPAKVARAAGSGGSVPVEACQVCGNEKLETVLSLGYMPPVNQMVAIGEESGALDKMLFKVAEFYEQEVNNAVDALASLLEPFIMVIIGTIVGGLVVGMYLPIFKLAAVVG